MENCQDSDRYFRAWEEFINSQQEPAELDGREVPYIHANSLTGYSNDIMLSPYADEHPALHDSCHRIVPLPSPPFGLNELMVDAGFGEPLASPSPRRVSHAALQYPTPSSVSHSIILADILPVECVVEQEADGGCYSLESSDAHFQSEQELFTLPSLPDSPAASVIDVAAFLKMGHAKECWCVDCGISDCGLDEVPDLVGVDKLTEIDDDWVVYWDADNIPATGEPAPSSDHTTGDDWLMCDIGMPGTTDTNWDSKQATEEIRTIMNGAEGEWDWDWDF
ncbi:hypothetical protein BAUCODRAFT_37975 [Baudoinia panamericana UAMH 10762]|uniref:Uncharacterized protein n=1 Tax=Baudoinia panamericana (strain UAMH 10762) TaxID=717646 RepID=M2M9I0_BAUPA|nr:uncharacterized protein BAUCODRAFT_37975 [Baudoinia panamericana UAMH 10762]EMC93056.1 hypothetical protein BAUCODRAFT_37975 [Baudoinia panamericana UAMH 10762]